jgi:hypothetical protein
MKINKILPAVVASIFLASTFSFTQSAQAADPVEVVGSPSISVADDGSFNYVPGEWSGPVSTLTVAWFSCPSAQLGAIGALVDLTQQLTDAGCTQVSTDKTLPDSTFDNVSTFPVVLEVADGSAAAFMGNSFIMYEKGVGPIAYSALGGAPLAKTVYFGGNSATLSAKSRSALHGLLRNLGNTSGTRVTINAYASKGGSASKNAAIALGRARQIMFFLKKKGVSGSFKIKLHTTAVSGAAGRKASVSFKFLAK